MLRSSITLRIVYHHAKPDLVFAIIYIVPAILLGFCSSIACVPKVAIRSNLAAYLILSGHVIFTNMSHHMPKSTQKFTGCLLVVMVLVFLFFILFFSPMQNSKISLNSLWSFSGTRPRGLTGPKGIKHSPYISTPVAHKKPSVRETAKSPKHSYLTRKE